MLARLKRLVGCDSGQDHAEYGIALAVIGVVAVSAAIAIGIQVESLWDPAQTTIDDVAHGHHGNNGNHGNGNNGNHGNGNNGNGNGNGP